MIATCWHHRFHRVSLLRCSSFKPFLDSISKIRGQCCQLKVTPIRCLSPQALDILHPYTGWNTTLKHLWIHDHLYRITHFVCNGLDSSWCMITEPIEEICACYYIKLTRPRVLMSPNFGFCRTEVRLFLSMWLSKTCAYFEIAQIHLQYEKSPFSLRMVHPSNENDRRVKEFSLFYVSNDSAYLHVWAPTTNGGVCKAPAIWNHVETTSNRSWDTVLHQFQTKR